MAAISTIAAIYLYMVPKETLDLQKDSLNSVNYCCDLLYQPVFSRTDL